MSYKACSFIKKKQEASIFDNCNPSGYGSALNKHFPGAKTPRPNMSGVDSLYKSETTQHAL